jgi:four helix bundle protein
MPLIERFEDIQGWQEARILTKMVYALTCKDIFGKDFGLKDQIRRASVSVMANIAEGFDCDSDIEFARFLGIARRSAAEVQSHLYAALDINYITQQEFDIHYEQARKAKALVGGFKRSLLKKHTT